MSDRDREILDMHFRNNLKNQADLEYFNNRKEDADFKSILEEETLIIKELENHDAARMKNRLQNLESTLSKKKNSKKSYLWILAVVLASLLAWYLLSNKTSSYNNSNLYAEFYSPYPNVIDPLTKGEINDLSIYQNYEKRDYQAVLIELNNKKEFSETESFYYAMTYMELEEFAKADSILNSFESSNFANDVIWYRALVCLKLATDDCSDQIEMISNNSNHPYAGKASALLNKMKNPSNRD